MNEQTAVVAVFHSHLEAETSIMELQLAGFGMQKLSIVGKDLHTEEHIVGYQQIGVHAEVCRELASVT